VSAEERTHRVLEKLLRTDPKPDLAARAPGSGEQVLHVAAKRGDTQAIILLGDVGFAPVDGRDGFNNTPLMIACWNGNPAAATALLDRGANANSRNERNMTPLHQCWGFVDRRYPEPTMPITTARVLAEQGRITTGLLRTLLSHGSRPNAETTDSRTALHYAATYGPWQLRRRSKHKLVAIPFSLGSIESVDFRPSINGGAMDGPRRPRSC